jgi:hypothetical protein
MEGPRVAAASATAREPPFELTFRRGGADYRAFPRQARRRGLERLVAELPAVALAVLGALLGYSVQRTVETDQHVFLTFARLAAITMPKRAVASADQAKRFVAFAGSMATAART